MENRKIIIRIRSYKLTATLENNSSAQSLIDHLNSGSIKLNMKDYAYMEKVGQLPKSFPQNNIKLNAEPGDIILYLGRFFVIYYGYNQYSLTKLGKIDENLSELELKEILGDGDVIAEISL